MFAKNYTDIYSAHNKGISVTVERFIRPLKIKSQKYVTAISKDIYIANFLKITKKYNNNNHKSIKMKPAYVKPDIYFIVSVESNTRTLINW